MWDIARPDPNRANVPYRTKGGNPRSGCCFCNDPQGEMHEYEMHQSDYSYFTCSKEECKTKGYTIARDVNQKIVTFVSEYLCKNAYKEQKSGEFEYLDGDEFFITIEGDEYILRTNRRWESLSETMQKYNIRSPQQERSDIYTSMVSLMHSKGDKLVDDMWKQIFITANEMVDGDTSMFQELEHVCIEVETYGRFDRDVTVDDFKIKLLCDDRYDTPYSISFLGDDEFDYYEHGRHRWG